MLHQSSLLRIATLFVMFSLSFMTRSTAQESTNGNIQFQGVPQLIVEAAKGSSVANVYYSHPAAFSYCGNQKAVVSLTKGLVSGSDFPLGDSELYFTASDTCGNEAVFKMIITVKPAGSVKKHDIPPVITPGLKQSAVDLKVFPNPARETLLADLTSWKEETLEICLYNQNGAALRTLTTEANREMTEISVSELPNGAYFLCVAPVSGAAFLTTPFIVRH